ncbi:hypothetical protein N431DRAFT_438411 [Stipitochalara longipes BDJ]|nr:hypothetical protein N431DRAFT_438411 [Stipitochalara longipes BDJ]
MSHPSSPITVPTEPAQSNGSVAQLKCGFSDCPEDREFPSELALRKHQDKHQRPYNCTVPDCKHPRFGDKGGLDRHKREVHGSKTYRCPLTSCKGHTRGFARKYNLFEHQKRCHPGQLLTPSMVVSRNSQSLTKSQRACAEVARDEEEEAPSPAMSFMKLTSDVAGASTVRLREKLRELLTLRAEIDGDVEALRRAMDILDDSSS